MAIRVLIIVTIISLWISNLAKSETLLNYGCSQYNASNLANFYTNLNATFLNLRSELLAGKYFATVEEFRASNPVYALVMCRNYLSTADCVACFDVAESRIRRCSGANGARVFFDGCFLRYESSSFYEESTMQGHMGICGNGTASNPETFEETVNSLLTDLETATPQINGFFATTMKPLASGGAVYGVAQCALTITQIGCRDCLKVGVVNINSCPPRADGKAIDAGCFLRYSDSPFFADDQIMNLGPILGHGGSSKRRFIIGGIAGGVGLLLLILGLFLWYKLSRAKAASRGKLTEVNELRGPMDYNYEDLKSATKNFSKENKLGEGGFGGVYKGVLRNGKIVAVKKLAIGKSERVKAEFESEVKLISNIHHRNLVLLLGCCRKGPELLLVYEYMANNSLDKFLFGQRRGTLNWKQRFDIILGTARGLAYLHEEFYVCIIHRDIKSSNILLDDNLQPKIADFGLARLLPGDQTHLSTKFAGTLGYMAPEYAIHGKLTEKVDTYGYGVVILEIISGQKSSEVKPPDNEFLLQRAWNLYENDRHMELVDETIDPDEYKPEDVKKIIQIALMCTQASVAQRPTMSQIVVLLKGKSSLEHLTVTKPTLVISEARPNPDISDASDATATITQVSTR